MKKKKMKMSALSITLICSLLATSITAFTASNIAKADTSDGLSSTYRNIGISDITEEGGDPAEITSAASSASQEKEWYEYVQYSTQSVGIYQISDNFRAVFYDPYDYSNALLMDVVDDLEGATEWSSANSVSVSYTTGSSMVTGLSDSSNTSTSVQVQDGVDETYGYSEGVSRSNTISFSKSKTIGDSKSDTEGESSQDTDGGSSSQSDSRSSAVATSFGANIGAEMGASIGGPQGTWGINGKVSASINTNRTTTSTWSLGTTSTQNWSYSYGTTRSSTTTHTSSETESNTEGQTDTTNTSSSVALSRVANRVTSATGSTISNTKSWSTNDSKTVSKTYNATYFNADGSPLQWKVVGYTVYMPMYYEIQCKTEDGWTTVGSAYCLMQTIQGTCRSWIENNTIYYEHWGTGEKVTENDFWDKFFTPQSLKEAYENKLYPDK